MGNIQVEFAKEIQGICLITPAVYADERGSFSEVLNLRDLQAAGFGYRFVQENQFFSYRGALRGMHFQRSMPQAKLIRMRDQAQIPITKPSFTIGKAFVFLALTAGICLAVCLAAKERQEA